MGNKYQKKLKEKGIDTGYRGGGKDPALQEALKSIMKDPGYTPAPSHQHWQVKQLGKGGTKTANLPKSYKGSTAT